MAQRRRWVWISTGTALVVALVALVVVGNRQGLQVAQQQTSSPADQSRSDTPGSTSAAPATTTTAPGTPPAWMHKLAPGEKPPQFVLFSFDGAGSHDHWQRMLPLAKKVNARFTGLLSGIYLLDNSHRATYTGPGHPPGKAAISFGGSADEVATRIADLNTAIADGHEIGTHYNGHFCAGAEPSIGHWTGAQWNSELDQFFSFVKTANAQGLKVDPGTIKGGRTPCLEGKWDVLFPALATRGMNYDSSKVSDGVAWPYVEDGVWEFPMPIVTVPALHRKVTMMDYNLWFSLNKAKDDPSRSAEFSKIILDTYNAAYTAALNGNRGPLVIGNHFNDWAGGAFSTAVEQFMGFGVHQAGDRVHHLLPVIQWMQLQDPEVLATLRKAPNAQPDPPQS